jgi:tRNA nucleotidyltransferase (CCA-adding enzyme)
MPVPQKIYELAQMVRSVGGRALLVGGCVRDALMTGQPKDWDVEVYSIEPPRLRQLLEAFGPVNVVGEAFTVYKIGSDVDVSLPRRERKMGRGHRGFVVEGDPSMTIEEAARRRDFTINAILQDPLTGEIIDPYNGRADIEVKTACVFFAPRSLPRASSLILSLRRSNFAAALTSRTSRASAYGARWKSYCCAHVVLQSVFSGCKNWVCSNNCFPN